MALIFKYRARNYVGESVAGDTEAPDKYAAIQKLRNKGLFVTEIWQATNGVHFLGNIRLGPRSKVSSKELALFCRQFATLSSSGIPIIQSINILAEQTQHRALIKSLDDIAESLQAGNSLGQALAHHRELFPAFFINMIEAGEISGSLDHVLERLAGYFESTYELMEKFKTAITYPMFVSVISLITIGCIFIFVLPTFAQIIIDLQTPVTLPTFIVLQLSKWLQKSWYFLIVIPFLLGLLYKKLSLRPQSKGQLDHFSLKVPIYGTIIKQINIVGICRTLAILLESGISLVESLEMIKSQVQNVVFAKALDQAIESLKEGNGLSIPLKGNSNFPPMVGSMIGVGEETGELDTILHRITNFYEREVYRSINRLMTLMEPILICLVGGIVSLIMISILMPIFSIMDSIQ
ncbi:type II secretion system F family protein [Desulfotomaculum defluvii]